MFGGDNTLTASASVTVLEFVVLTVQNFVLQDALPITVEGLVTDMGGNPIPGATVDFHGDISTDQTGHYSFTEVPNTSITEISLDVRATGFVSTSLNIDAANGATIIQNFVLEKQGVLTGHVTGPGGTPLGGASLILGTSQAFTDVTGLYSIMLDPGEYTVTVELGGFRTITTSTPILSGETIVSDFVLDKALPGSITGFVTDDGGNIIGGKVVAAGLTATRNADGSYTLAPVLPGSVQVTASAGFRFIPETDTVVVNEGEATVLNFALVLKNPNF